MGRNWGTQTSVTTMLPAPRRQDALPASEPMRQMERATTDAKTSAWPLTLAPRPAAGCKRGFPASDRARVQQNNRHLCKINN